MYSVLLAVLPTAPASLLLGGGSEATVGSQIEDRTYSHWIWHLRSRLACGAIMEVGGSISTEDSVVARILATW